MEKRYFKVEKTFKNKKQKNILNLKKQHLKKAFKKMKEKHFK